jgi:DNA-binding response OmpR family regulator
MAGMPVVVALVEDDADSREAQAELLRYAGFEVFEFESAEDALAWMVDHEPDVVVTDLSLPGVDGRELARRVRARPSLAKTRIVAATGHLLGREAEFDRVLRKPLDPDELSRIIGELALG